MAYGFTINVVNNANGGAHAMFDLKELLVAAGWVVMASGGGTGSGLYSAIGDVIATAAIMNTSRAWVRIQDPAGGREFCWQRGSGGNAAWWIKVSAEDKFTGGAADEDDMPTATDEQNLHGSTTAGTTLFAAAATYHHHCAADNAAPYGFYLFDLVNGTGAQDMAFVFEPLVTGTYPVEDDDPALYYVRQSTPFNINQLSAGGTGPFGWWAKDTGGEAFVRYPACVYNDSGGTRQFPGVGTNPENNKDDTIPIPYIRGSASFATQIGVKGLAGTVMRWQGVTRATGDTLSVTVARDRIIVGNVALPWDPGVVPVI